MMLWSVNGVLSACKSDFLHRDCSEKRGVWLLARIPDLQQRDPKTETKQPFLFDKMSYNRCLGANRAFRLTVCIHLPLIAVLPIRRKQCNQAYCLPHIMIVCGCVFSCIASAYIYN